MTGRSNVPREYRSRRKLRSLRERRPTAPKTSWRIFLNSLAIDSMKVFLFTLMSPLKLNSPRTFFARHVSCNLSRTEIQRRLSTMRCIHKSFGLAVTLSIIMTGTFFSRASAQEAKTINVTRQYIITKDSVVGVPYQRIPNSPYDTMRVTRNWSQLKRDMTETEVRTVFGTPAVYQEDGENGLIYWWYGGRAVVFNGITKKVSGWDN